MDCANQQKIADTLYGYYVGITANNQPSEFWNHLSTEQIKTFMSIDNNPCRLWFESQGLKVRDMSYTITNNKISTSTHKDAPPVVAKINFPVLNTADTYNVWFDDQGKEIDKVECVHPIVFRSDILHTVEIGNTAKFPRLQFSFCFYKEPLDLLK